MPLEVKIPPMGESISSGILAKWHVKNGDTVTKDQPLFELETDKITSEGTAEAAGVITLKVEAGTEVKIGQVVAAIEAGAAGSAPAAPASAPAPAAKAAATEASPAVRRLAGETGINPADVTGTGKAGRVTKGGWSSLSMRTAPSTQAVTRPRRLRQPVLCGALIGVTPLSWISTVKVRSSKDVKSPAVDCDMVMVIQVMVCAGPRCS